MSRGLIYKFAHSVHCERFDYLLRVDGEGDLSLLVGKKRGAA